MPARVALIVRCYNEEAHIGRLLTGATRQTRPPDEIVVVDSGSNDATLSIAAAFGVKPVSISPDRFSFGHALNIGLRESANADVAVFASAHVYPVYDTWLERLIAPFEDADVALTYGRQIAPPYGRLSEQRLLAQWFPATSQRRQRHPFCNNANAAIRRSVWEALPFDESLTGLEDLDWSKKVTALGHAVSYVAEAPVVHVHDESFTQVLNRYRREAIAHKQIYDDQRMTALHAARLAAVNIIRDYGEAVRRRTLRSHLRDIPEFRIAQFLGTYRGFSQSGPVTEALRHRFYYPVTDEATIERSADAPKIGRVIDYESIDGA